MVMGPPLSTSEEKLEPIAAARCPGQSPASASPAPGSSERQAGPEQKGGVRAGTQSRLLSWACWAFGELVYCDASAWGRLESPHFAEDTEGLEIQVQ